jgi:hypothetical protein
MLTPAMCKIAIIHANTKAVQDYLSFPLKKVYITLQLKFTAGPWGAGRGRGRGRTHIFSSSDLQLHSAPNCSMLAKVTNIFIPK